MPPRQTRHLVKEGGPGFQYAWKDLAEPIRYHPQQLGEQRGFFMTQRTPHQDALRILYIFLAGAEERKPGADGCERVFKGNTRLYAFDFWIRNPDYFADELLDLFDATHEQRYLTLATKIFEDNEPSIRRFPMIRYRFGAYERIDDALAILVSRGLIRIDGRKTVSTVSETNFYLLPDAVILGKDITKHYPGLSWYPERAALVAEVAAKRKGAELKKRQYQRIEYAETQLGGVIPAVTERVRERLAGYNAKAAG